MCPQSAVSLTTLHSSQLQPSHYSPSFTLSLPHLRSHLHRNDPLYSCDAATGRSSKASSLYAAHIHSRTSTCRSSSHVACIPQLKIPSVPGSSRWRCNPNRKPSRVQGVAARSARPTAPRIDPVALSWLVARLKTFCRASRLLRVLRTPKSCERLHRELQLESESDRLSSHSQQAVELSRNIRT